jgi:hypothetical protein
MLRDIEYKTYRFRCKLSAFRLGLLGYCRVEWGADVVEYHEGNLHEMMIVPKEIPSTLKTKQTLDGYVFLHESEINEGIKTRGIERIKMAWLFSFAGAP